MNHSAGALGETITEYWDEDAWLRLWSESEQSYYASSPMFMVEAVK